MLIRKAKYKRLRQRVSAVPYYWRKYEKKFPENSLYFYTEFKMSQLLTQTFYESLTRSFDVPFVKKTIITKRQYKGLAQYARINKRLQRSLKQNKALKRK